MSIRIIVLIYFAFISSMFAHDMKKKKALKSHEHGVGILNIAQDQDMLLFEFEMPGFDVVGFEYKAEKDEDLKKVENALTLLSNYKNMIKPSGSAECEHIESKSEVIYEGKHSEFISNYKFKCSKIDNLKVIYIKHFKKFQYSKKLNIKIVGSNKKTAYVIDKSKQILNVKGFFNDN